MAEIEQLAILLVRWLGTGLLVVALAQAIANVVDSANSFHPGHAAHYVRSQLLRPAVLAAVGLAVLLLSGPLGASLAGGLGL